MGKYMGREDIIKSGRLNISKLQSMEMLHNSLSSELTLCRKFVLFRQKVLLFWPVIFSLEEDSTDTPRQESGISLE